jgi:predicted  nucleic acid-binding Zn-ribbon protein
MLSQTTDGPGLYEVTEPDGTRWITNLTRKIGGRGTPPGRRLVNTAAVLLGLLDAGLFAVSLAAQYQYIFHAKHQSWPAIIEAVALDAGMVIFSLLALGLARGRQAAPVERALIVVCALGSAAMNYGAADVSSLRSVAAYVMPPVFLAIVTDRVIAVVRRHMLGMEAERSAWVVIGRVVLAVLTGAGKVVLYGLRLVLAPRSTCSGARTLVLLATPLPGAHVLVDERAQVDAARAALGTVRAAIGDELRELRDLHDSAAAHAGDSLRAGQEAARTQAQAVRDTLRTELQAVREAARTDADAAARATLATMRTALGGDLRELRDLHDSAAAHLDGSLSATRDDLRTEIDSVREAVRTELQAVREALRAQAAEQEPPAVDRDAVVAELANQIRDAISSGEQWTPDYDALMTRTGYRRSWCEKAVRDARTAVFTTPGNPDGSPS